MKCGNCKSVHDSAAEVKACYNGASSPKTSAMMDQLAAERPDRVTTFARPDKEEIQSERPETTMKRSAIPAHLRPDTNLSSTRDWSRPTFEGEPVMDGIYAVVLDGDEKQVTLRFHVLTMGPRQGVQVVDYLRGPDNENDWERFANVVDGGYRVFNKFLSTLRLTNALVLMMKADRETLMTAGEGYARRSGRCWRCYRLLTVEESIVRGMGPVCADKMGVA